MAKPRKRRTSPERRASPQGRDTPVIGPRAAPKKVRTLRGKPAIARPYDPGVADTQDDNPWQDPGGGEPANG